MADTQRPASRRSLHLGSLTIPWWWVIVVALLPSAFLLGGASVAFGGRGLGYALAGIAMLATARTSGRPIPWTLLGVGSLTIAVGDVAVVSAGPESVANAEIGLVGLWAAAGYLLGAAGLWLLRPGGRSHGLLDGLIVAIGGLAVGMTSTLIPMLSETNESSVDQTVLVVGAFAIVVRLAAGARLVSDLRPLPAEGWALAAWLGLDFVGNALWVASLGSVRAAIMGVLWFAAAMALGVLAVAPSRTVLEREPGSGRRAWMTRTRALALAGAAVVPMLAFWFRRDDPFGWILLAMGMTTFALVVARMILVTEDLARHRNQLDHMAHHDPVSGLPNRAMFERRMRELRSGDDPPEVAVLYVDLDDFKDINDRFGHEVGDLVLAEAGERLKASVRGHDMVA
ncbi:MAG: GGDEF domain-containing protein, partial [Microthrixaceae bacterium]|nr:GGDEF domain-containing protein [Microthrixaceae bacterium]